ncbi:hypothetical protein [Flavobacterium sp.]|uniref:hypothetical protein n=1 Tax=Flavobacterium sp. TaxID=239 RepID=UPI003D6C24FA
MKNFLFGLVAIVMFSFAGSANNVANHSTDPKEVKTESASITIQTKDAKTVYAFNSLNDFKNYTNQIIESVDSVLLEEACTVTITMTVTVTVSGGVPGVAQAEVATSVSGSVTTSCADAVAAGKKLRANLLLMAQG